MLTKEEITNSKKPSEATELPGGKSVFIRHLSGKERIRFVRTVTQDGDLDAVLGVMLFLGYEDDTRVYSDEERSLVEAPEFDGELFQDIFLAGLRVNGLTEGAEDKAEKN